MHGTSGWCATILSLASLQSEKLATAVCATSQTCWSGGALGSAWMQISRSCSGGGRMQSVDLCPRAFSKHCAACHEQHVYIAQGAPLSVYGSAAQ